MYYTTYIIWPLAKMHLFPHTDKKPQEKVKCNNSPHIPS